MDKKLANCPKFCNKNIPETISVAHNLVLTKSEGLEHLNFEIRACLVIRI